MRTLFLCSTSKDFQPIREQLLDGLKRLKGWHVFAAEDSTAITGSWAREDAQIASTVDLTVFLIGHYRGTCPRVGTSHVEIEYDAADDSGKKMLVFMASDAATAGTPQQSAAARSQQEVFRARVRAAHDRHGVREFTDQSQLIGMVLAAIYNETANENRIEHESPEPWVAVTEWPYTELIGRARERERLVRWYCGKGSTVMFLEGTAGIGKSALAWNWMWSDVIGSVSRKPDGVLWWSFDAIENMCRADETPFRRFLGAALAYTGCKDEGYSPMSRLLTNLKGRRFLFVLDAFEHELHLPQERERTSTNEISGSFLCKDSLARAFLRYFGTCSMESRMLVCTRYLPQDAERSEGGLLTHCDSIRLDPLDEPSAVQLMRRTLVSRDMGTDAELRSECRRLGGNPLALLWASHSAREAARFRDIKCPLARSDDLLRSSSVQMDLVSAVSSLGLQARHVLGSLACFRYAPSFEALFQVSGLRDANELDRVLSLLRGRNMLVGDPRRLRLHELTRAAAYEQVPNKAQVHAAIAMHLVSRLGIKLPDPNDPPPGGRILKSNLPADEDLHLRAEVYAQLLLSGDRQRALALLRDNLIYPLFYTHSNIRMALDLLELAVVEGGTAASGVRTPLGRLDVFALNFYANCARMAGNVDLARQLHQQVIDYEAETPKLACLLHMHKQLKGMDDFWAGDYQGAEQLWLETLRYAKECGNPQCPTCPQNIIACYREMARLYLVTGRYAEARNALIMADQTQSRPAPEYECEVLALSSRLALASASDAGEALRLADRGVAVEKAVPALRSRASILAARGRALMALKRMDAAEEALLEALQIAIRTEHWPLQIEVRCVCARLLAGRKLTHEAEDELDESLHLARHGGYRGAERSIELTRHATIKSDGIWSSLA